MEQSWNKLRQFMRHHSKVLSFILVGSLLSFAFNLTSCEKSQEVGGRTAEDRIMNAWNPSTDANTASGTYSSGLAYYVNDAGTEAAVAKGDCVATSVVIPSLYNTIPVVGIKEEGFIDSTSIVSVSLPSSITMIGSASFKNTGLTSLTLPDSMVTINPMTFMNCQSLTAVNFLAGASGNQITSIGEYAFAGCGRLGVFDLPSKCGIIGKAAFQGDSSLIYFIFPKKCPDPSNSSNTVITLGEYAFADCSSLSYVFFSEVTTITVGDYAFKNCKSGATGEFEGAIPSALSSSTNWKYLQNSKYLTITANVGSVYYSSGFFFHADTHNYDGKPTGYGDDVYIMRYNGSASTDTAGSVALSIPPLYKDSDGVLHRIVGIGDDTVQVFASHYELGSLTFSSLFDTDGDGVKEDIPNNIRYLGSFAFAQTKNLATVDLLSAVNLLEIHSGCFGNTSLGEDRNGTNNACTSLVFPHTLKTIGSYAFCSWGALASIRFDGTNASDPSLDTASLTTIGPYAFKFKDTSGARGDCVITFPKTLTAFSGQGSYNDSSAFSWCHWIKGLVFTEPTDTTTKLSIAKWVFSRDYFIDSITLSSNITYFGEQSFEYLSGDDSYSGTYGQHWKGLDWPISSIHSLFIPSGTSLSSNIFQHTVRLTFYSDASSLSSGFNGMIEDFDVTANGRNTYPDSGFNGPVYYNVSASTLETDGGGTITNSVTPSTTLRNRIHYAKEGYGDFDFVQDSVGSTNLILTRFNYNGADTSATAASTITTPKIPETITLGATTYTVTSIGDAAFFDSYYSKCGYTSNVAGGITEVTIPNSVTSIGARSFARCNLLATVNSYTGDNVSANTLPSSMTSLGAYAFAWDALTAITIPGEVTTFGGNNIQGPFVGNSTLASITMSTPGTFNSDGYIVYKKSGTNSYYYINSVALAHSFGNLTINNSVNEISKVAFRDCSTLTGLTTGTGLKTIQNQAFRNCTNLTSVNLSSSTSLTTIGEQAFYGDNKLATLNASGCANLTSIGASAFNGNSALTSVNFTNCTAQMTFGNTSFYGTSKLTGLDLSSCTSLKAINYQAFMYSMSSTTASPVSVKMPETAANTTFLSANSPFENCSKMTSLDIGCATVLGSYSFKGCTNLSSVDFGSVATINYQAFMNDTSLPSTLVLPSTCLTMGAQAFYNDTSITSVSWAGDSASSDNSAVTFSGGDTKCFARSSAGSSLTSIVIPKGSTMLAYTFLNQTGLKTASPAVATSGIFLKDTGPEYDATSSSRYPANWNAVSADSGDSTRIAQYALYCPTDSASYKSNVASDANYWKYVDGVPTIYDPTSF